MLFVFFSVFSFVDFLLVTFVRALCVYACMRVSSCVTSCLLSLLVPIHPLRLQSVTVVPPPRTR